MIADMSLAGQVEAIADYRRRMIDALLVERAAAAQYTKAHAAKVAERKRLNPTGKTQVAIVRDLLASGPKGVPAIIDALIRYGNSPDERSVSKLLYKMIEIGEIEVSAGKSRKWKLAK